MDYKLFYGVIEKFKKNLEIFALENDRVDSTYYTALRLIDELHTKAYLSEKSLEASLAWLNGGKTIALKNALKFTSYDDNNLVHCNAMSLMDSVKLMSHGKA